MFNNTDSPASSNAPFERLADTSSQFPQLSHSHRAQDVRRAESTSGPTAPFSSLIEEYVAMAPSDFKPSTVLSVRRSLAMFFQFVARDQQIAERKVPHVQ
jgi:hypothetical protein